MVRAILPLALLVACGGGTYNQGDDFTNDTSSPTSDDTGVDTDDTSGTDDTSDTEDTAPTACTNSWEPIDQTGWTKQYTATFQGSEGTATMTGVGPVAGETDVYEFEDAIETSGNSYDVVVKVGCNTEGEGMFVLGWEGDYTYVIMDVIPVPGAVTAELDPYRKYMPPEYAIGSTGNWDYSYTLNVVMQDSGSATPTTVAVTGTFSEIGFSSYTLPDGVEAQAYKLTNTYSMISTDGLINMNGYIEQYWVKGIGLVLETNTNTDDGTETLHRLLTSYSGLTAQD